MGRIRERFPEVFAPLSEADAEALETGAQSSVVSGCEPPADSVQRIAHCLTRKLTREQFIAAAIEAAAGEAAR